MSKQKLTCPVCGSEKIKRHENENHAYLTLGERFNFQEIYYKCENCEEEIDILNETDKSYLLAKKQAEKALVKKIIAKLSALGISMAYFERVFELPIRTLTRWKNGDFSANALALLRIINTYPWMVEVADEKFEPTFAKEILLRNIAVINFPKNNITISTNPVSYIGMDACNAMVT
ncbi:MAG: hypothetical protein WC748_02010 [Legionellales bacterium]|jgi:transposase-like protein